MSGAPPGGLLIGPDWAGVRILATTRRPPEAAGWPDAGVPATGVPAAGSPGAGSPAAGSPAAGAGDFNLALHTVSDPTAVLANQRLLRARLPAEPCWLTQVHGTDVHDADRASDAPPDGGAPRADASVTAQPGRVLAILTADCLPVVLCSMNDRVAHGRALGMAHAGWRGLAGGVLERTLAALKARAPAAGWRAWIGPAIRQENYRVGADVRQAFVDEDPGASAYFLPVAGQGWLADLPGLARHRLLRAGVDEVQDCGRCTFGEPGLFYSHRRDAGPGRQATVAWLSDS